MLARRTWSTDATGRCRCPAAAWNRLDVTFLGIDMGDSSGYPVASAGDVNGDGLDDLLIVAGFADLNGFNAGETYLIYGRGGAAQLPGTFDLGSADVTFSGIDAGDNSGCSVASAGDVNGDGLDDLLIGAKGVDVNGFDVGETYLVYGRDAASPLSGAFDLRNADVTFSGIDADDQSGVSVAPAGDVNGDGLDDLLIGAHKADPNADSDAGETYLVYGGGLSGDFNLANADVTFNGIHAGDQSGLSVSAAGDVNGDGLDDLLIGSPGADSNAGATYMVYGRGGPAVLAGHFDLAAADVTFSGFAPSEHSGSAVASAGDVNGDGLADLLIGAKGA